MPSAVACSGSRLLPKTSPDLSPVETLPSTAGGAGGSAVTGASTTGGGDGCGLGAGAFGRVCGGVMGSAGTHPRNISNDACDVVNLTPFHFTRG